MSCNFVLFFNTPLEVTLQISSNIKKGGVCNQLIRNTNTISIILFVPYLLTTLLIVSLVQVGLTSLIKMSPTNVYEIYLLLER